MCVEHTCTSAEVSYNSLNHNLVAGLQNELSSQDSEERGKKLTESKGENSSHTQYFQKEPFAGIRSRQRHMHTKIPA